MKPAMVAIVGRKKSGKTTTVEVLTRELTRRGYRVATVKHISEPDFTVDREEKDTWRYAQAGAKMIVGVSSSEIFTIEKKKTSNFSLKEFLRRCGNSDVVLLEGFRNLVAKNKRIPKIVVLKSKDQAAEDTEFFNHVLAFTGPYNPKLLEERIPYVDITRNPGRLADLVEKAVLKKVAT